MDLESREMGHLHGTWDKSFGTSLHISLLHLVGCLETSTQGALNHHHPSISHFHRSWTNQVTSLLHQVGGINSRQMKSSLDMSPPTRRGPTRRWKWCKKPGLLGEPWELARSRCFWNSWISCMCWVLLFGKILEDTITLLTFFRILLMIYVVRFRFWHSSIHLLKSIFGLFLMCDLSLFNTFFPARMICPNIPPRSIRPESRRKPRRRLIVWRVRLSYA